VEICLFTDALADLTLDQALDFIADSDIGAVEIAAGGMSRAPHMRVFELLGDSGKRVAFADKIASRGLRLSAVNCAAWPMHPVYGDGHVDLIRAAIRVAGELEVDKIVTMSGCPGDLPDSRTVNWIVLPWAPEAPAILEEQWNIAIELWGDLAEYAKSHGVRRIALELAPLQLVYNVPTLVRLRNEVGPTIGANLDPSHFFWQRIDTLEVVRALGPAIHHVHVKDVVYDETRLGLAGALDTTSFSTPAQRAWVFRTVGRGQPVQFWRAFTGALTEVGYDDVLSIEQEDPFMPGEAGVREAVAFVTDLLKMHDA
jgi:sugar phosphate isomerase/epimerase